jgi:PAS domain S-box-containing protein
MAKILIVEDESVLRMTFAHFLEEEQHEVATVEQYDEAVACIDREHFDVIVTDIILEGKTGIDLLKTVHERKLKCAVIMVTGEPNVETASEAVRLGAYDYLPKPVTGRELKRVVRLALGRRRIEDERDLYAIRMEMYRRDMVAIFNSISEGIVSVDANMNIRQVNPVACTLLESKEAKLIDHPVSNGFAPHMRAACDALQRTLETRKPVLDFRLEVSIKGEGTKILVMHTTPLVSDDGGHAGAILVIRDITRVTLLEKQLGDSHRYHNMVGKSARMREVFNLLDNVSDTESTVLIYGESGTGKELVAAALHESSPRSTGPFLKVNCAALSSEILESELFGHVQGAFTGAVRDRIGRFEAADGGTILLDEIGDITPRLQLQLLRVLQEREFERVGDTNTIKVNVRIIASTNRNLMQKIEAHEFREDLYYRLNVVRIELPPLRERRDDIPLLVDQFCKHFNMIFNKEIVGLSPESLDIMVRYPWAGNVRELENCLERAFIVCHDTVILPKHLPPEIHQFGTRDREEPVSSPVMSPRNSLTREQIQEVLSQTDWNIAKTARILGIARNTLYQKIKTLNILRSRS